MVLGYGGFLGLSTKQYQEKLRTTTLEELQKQELVKIRAQVACVYSILSGIGWAYFTFGGSLVVCGIGGRKWRVADRKLGMIRQELLERGELLHKMDWKDVAIPLTACAVGTAAGAGIDVGFSSLINVGDVATSASGNLTTSGSHSQELQAMFQHPGHAVKGLAEGVVFQPDQVMHGGAPVIAEHLNMPSGDVPIQTIDLDPSALSSQLSEISGAQLGAHAATSIERAIGQIVAQEISWWIIESCEDIQFLTQAAKNLGCGRYVGVTNLDCDECGGKIDHGSYWHCCHCLDDNFDICKKCFYKGATCLCEVNNLRELQFAWAGNLCYPDRRRAFQRFEQEKYPRCGTCKTKIKQGRYFQCTQCNAGKGFDLCLSCYRRGAQCLGGQRHALYSFSWAQVPSSDTAHPYLRKNAKNGACQCEACGVEVWQGAFYHCSRCKGSEGRKEKRGYFDLCHSCYESGSKCKNVDHVLLRFNAFDQKRHANPVTDKSWSYCHVPDCHRSLAHETRWYTCNECKINDGDREGDFSICNSCYGSGAGCLNRQHHMMQTSWGKVEPADAWMP